MNESTTAKTARSTDPADALTGVLNVLRQSNPSLETKSYSYSVQNSLPPDWLIQSAPDDSSCQLLNTLQTQLATVVQSAPDRPHFIDFTQMGNQKPEDPFQAALIASFIAIACSAQQPVIIRYLEGNPAGTANEQGMTFINHLNELCTSAGLAASNVYFYAASFAIPWTDVPISGLPGSWTHAKIFAIDGVTCIAGGQNYWVDYLPGQNPPHDVSMQLNGASAAAGHNFANVLWSYVASARLYCQSLQLGTGQFSQMLPPMFDQRSFPPPAQPEATPVLAVGNLGMWIPGELKTLLSEAVAAISNPSRQVSPKDTYPVIMSAFNVLLDFPFSQLDADWSKATQASTTARHLLLQTVQQNGHLRISQQKIADPDVVGRPVRDGRGGLPWPGQFMQAIIAAMTDKNATVDIIVSFHEDGASSPVDGYSDDVGAASLRGVIVDLLARALGGDMQKAQSMAAQLLTVKATQRANHAKIWIVDDQIFFVGSDNIYPAYLQEFGYVVGSVQKTQEFISNYWNPMWAIAVAPPTKNVRTP